MVIKDAISSLGFAVLGRTTRSMLFFATIWAGAVPIPTSGLAPSHEGTPAPSITLLPTAIEKGYTKVESTTAPLAIPSTPSPTVPLELTPKPVPQPTPGPTPHPTSVTTDTPVDDKNRVSKPYFLDPSVYFVTSVTFHIACDTDGAIVRYTLDGTEPVIGSQTIAPRKPLLVDTLGSVTIRAVAEKQGMSDSEEIKKTVTVEDRVATPEISFKGEVAPGEPAPAYLRSTTMALDCATEGATIFYTTDGDVPDENSAQVAPGTELRWVEEGLTVFQAVAKAPDMYHSEVGRWEVRIVAPPVDEQALAEASLGNGVQPQVEVVSLEKVYQDPYITLDSGDCAEGPRIVRGKVLRLANPGGHFSFLTPLGVCEDGQDSVAEEALAEATAIAQKFEPERPTVSAEDGESWEEARTRLGLDEKELAWEAAKGLGCQAVMTAGPLDPGEGERTVPCRGHVVSMGKVIRAEDNTGLVSFGVRNGQFVVGHITAEEVHSKKDPFTDLVSGAGWLVRDGLNHIEMSVRDGDLGDLDLEVEEIVSSRMARTAIGYDPAGRLILLQMSGASELGQEDLDGSKETPRPKRSDGVDLYELADLLIEAGAVNAVNLAGGGYAIMTQNRSVIVDPADACTDEDLGWGGLVTGSRMARCERNVSGILCVHLNPPPILEGSSPAQTQAPRAPVGSDGGESKRKEEMRLRWTEELCFNETGNGTGLLWEHLDRVEQSAHVYKIAFWMAAVLGLASLWANVRNYQQKDRGGAELGGISGGGVGGLLEMQQRTGGGNSGTRAGTRSGRQRGKIGKYARVNSNDSVDGAPAPNGHYEDPDDEEIDVDLGLDPPQQPSRCNQGNGIRFKRAIGGAADSGRKFQSLPSHEEESESEMEVEAQINPFIGGGGGRTNHPRDGGSGGGGKRGNGKGKGSVGAAPQVEGEDYYNSGWA